MLAGELGSPRNAEGKRALPSWLARTGEDLQRRQPAARRTPRAGLEDRELRGSAAYGARELRGVPRRDASCAAGLTAPLSRPLAASREPPRERGSAVAAPESSRAGRPAPALRCGAL